MKKIQILLVDDHPVVRQGFAALLESEEDLCVCGEASELSEALQLVHELNPDLIIVDISLKKGSGLDLIKEVRSKKKNIKILVASMHDESLFAERCLRAGAQGYINKDEATLNIVTAIRHVLANEIYLSPQMTKHLLKRAANPDDGGGRLLVERLSDRELTVFEMIGNGKTTRQIAEDLHLSIKTIETYREHIKTKLNLPNAAELSRHAVQWVLEKK